MRYPVKITRNQKRRHGDHHSRIQLRFRLGGSIAPVHAVVDVISRIRILSLVSQILLNLLHGSVYIHAGGQHHTEVCAERLHPLLFLLFFQILYIGSGNIIKCTGLMASYSHHPASTKVSVLEPPF